MLSPTHLVCSFQVPHGRDFIILATSAGAPRWNVKSIIVSDKQCSYNDPSTCRNSNHHKLTMSLWFSPTAAISFANYGGFVISFAIFYSVSQAITNTKTSGRIGAASRWVDVTHAKAFYGGLDFPASTAFQNIIFSSSVYNNPICSTLHPFV